MTSSIVNSTPYPFTFDVEPVKVLGEHGKAQISLEHVRGRVPSLQASKLRALMLQANDDPSKTMATTCTYDGLSSRLVEEAGFPLVFLAGYAMASAHGLPDTGYIAMQDVCAVIQQVARQVTVPIIADGDTGYGSPMNVKRCVESFALAGAAGIMIEDQTWPKRCGHTKGKSVVGRGEAFARIQAAVDARNNGLDIWILARTDALIEGWDEAILRAKEFERIGVDAVFVEALPDKAAMEKCAKEIGIPVMANIIEGGQTEQLSAQELASIGYAGVFYPWTLVAAKLKSIRETLEALKASMTTGSPPEILSYAEVCRGVGFEKYWAEEENYRF